MLSLSHLTPRRLLLVLAALAIVVFSLVGFGRRLKAAYAEYPTDFSIMLGGARALAQSEPLYDVEALSVQPYAGVYKQAPVFALLLRPLTLFEDELAWFLWRTLSLVLLAAALLLLAGACGRRITSLPFLVLVLAVLNFEPVTAGLAGAQTDILLLFLPAAALWCLGRRRQFAAGTLIALAGVVKVYPLVLALAFLRRDRLRALAGLFGGLALLAVLSLAAAGIETNAEWLTRVLPLAGRPTPWAENQSYVGFFGRLLADHPGDLRLPLQPFPLTAAALANVASALTLALAAYFVFRQRSAGGWDAAARDLSLLAPVALLITPAAWSHYETLLVLSLAFLVFTYWPARAPESGGAPVPLLLLAAALGLLATGWSSPPATSAALALIVAGSAALAHRPRIRGLPLLVMVALVSGYALTAFGGAHVMATNWHQLWERSSTRWLLSDQFFGVFLLFLGLLGEAHLAGGRARFRWQRAAAAALLGAALLVATSALVLLRSEPWPQSATLDEAAIEHRVEATFGGTMRLLGFSAPLDSAQPGEEFPVTLYWQALEETDADYKVSVKLLNRLDETCGEHDARPARWKVPTFQWQAGDYITDLHPLALPDSCRPGVYHLEVVVYELHTLERIATPQGDRLLLAQLLLRGPQVDPSRLPHAMRAQLGDDLQLRGYDARREGAALTVTLFWQARRPLERDYTVFVHLVDAQGRIMAQHDGPPALGTYPTSAWPPGEVVEDEHLLRLPDTGEQEEYELRVGLYYLPTMERLPVPAPGDYLRLRLP